MDQTESMTNHHRMEKAFSSYFKTECRAAGWMFIWAVVTSLIALYLWLKGDSPLEKGMLFPCLIFGVVLLWLGFFGFLNNRKRLREARHSFENQPENWVEKELVRMQLRAKSVKKFQSMDMLLFILGFALICSGAFGVLGSFALGTGVGLTAQTAFVLVFNLISGYLGGLYEYELTRYKKNV